MGSKKQALLRDMEYVVNSLDKHIKDIMASHALRMKSVVERVSLDSCSLRTHV